MRIAQMATSSPLFLKSVAAAMAHVLQLIWSAIAQTTKGHDGYNEVNLVAVGFIITRFYSPKLLRIVLHSNKSLF